MPQEAIVSATSKAADFLGLDRVVSLMPEKEAGILMVVESPQEDRSRPADPVRIRAVCKGPGLFSHRVGAPSNPQLIGLSQKGDFADRRSQRKEHREDRRLMNDPSCFWVCLHLSKDFVIEFMMLLNRNRYRPKGICLARYPR